MSRPYPEPVRFAVMHQRWCDLTFLHWRFPAASVAKLVPRALTVETFDASAWVGVTPFWLSGLRPPFLPPLPWFSAFPETNCRTYVRGPDGEPGVWFFSLDAARVAAVIGARTGYGLPYAWSRMRVETTDSRVRYESQRRWPDQAGRTRIEVTPGEAIEAGELEDFLTARFRLYSLLGGCLTFTRVEHPPWPLHAARATTVEQTLTSVAGLPEPQGPPLVHFSPGVAVRVSRPHSVGARTLRHASDPALSR